MMRASPVRRSGVATAPAARASSSSSSAAAAARRARASRPTTMTTPTPLSSSSRSASSKPKASSSIVASSAASSSSSPSPPATTTSAAAPVRVLEMGSASVLGSSRKKNEDRFKISTTTAPFELYAGVFDGHGGSAVSEWLTENLESYLVRRWPLSKGGSGSGGRGAGGSSATVEAALTDAFLAADRKLLQPKAGFFGVGERGVGGSKCGSTAALVVLFPESDGSTSLAAANVGDARVVLCRSGKAVQLTTDHVPDSEDERLRIERMNPNPKLPLVRFVGGTWRVGGLLALSRAFGDSFMKGTGQFEGLKSGVGTSYESGFGVTAEPDVTVTELNGEEDRWLIVSSDGLLINVERGGGGGLTNEQAVAIAEACGSAEEAARALVAAAVEAGSTDDVTVLVFKLGS